MSGEEKNSFLNKLGITEKIWLIVIIMMVLNISISFVKNYLQLHNAYVAGNKQKVITVTESALNLLEEYKNRVANGELSREEAQERAIKRVNNLNFDKNNYVWIHDYTNKFLAHPTLQDKDGSSLVDKTGFRLIVEATKTARDKGQGFISYHWPKPGKDPDKVYLKSSYIRNFPDWEWVIGAGIFNDDIGSESGKELFVSVIWDTGINIIIVLLLAVIVVIPIIKTITNPINNLVKTSKRIAENDLGFDMPEDSNKTEIGDLNRAFRTFLGNYKGLISSMTQTITQITTSTGDMNSAIEQTSEGARQVSSSIEQLAQGANQVAGNVNDSVTNLHKLNNLINEINKDSVEVAELGNTTESNANQGRTHIQNAVNKINSIRESSEEVSEKITKLGDLSSEIEQIVDLIKNIAGQTNLLALNAAIEAARAGEHGRGFAVVADEVKKLAGQSAEATDKINNMIREIQEETTLAISTMDKASTEVDGGVEVINNVGEELVNIIDQVKLANSKIQNISVKMEDVSNNSGDILQMMEDISSVTEETAANTEEMSSITEEQTANLEQINSNSKKLSKIAQDLNSQIINFKL